MKMRTIITTCMLSLIIWLFNLSQASAISIVTYTNDFNSLTNEWTYDMTVENMDIDPLYDLKVDIGTDLPGFVLSSPTSPTGWSPIEIGTDFIHWMNISGDDVKKGITMSGFSFKYTGLSTNDIGSIPYHTITWNNVTGRPNPICNGMTGSPSDCQSNASVPEPGSLLLVLVGMLMSILLYQRWEQED